MRFESFMVCSIVVAGIAANIGASVGSYSAPVAAPYAGGVLGTGVEVPAASEIEWTGRSSMRSGADDQLIVCNQALTQCWLADLTGDGLLTIYAANGSTLATLTVGPLNASSASFGDGNITNVGDIDVDSISADGTNILIDANAGTLTVSGPTSHLNDISFSDCGSSCNSKTLSFVADNAGTAETATLQTIYGADPYLRISAPNDSGVATAVCDIHDTAIVFTTDNAVDIGASGANRPKNIYASGLLNIAGSTTLGDAPGTDTLQINAATTASGTMRHLNNVMLSAGAPGGKLCFDGTDCHEYITQNTNGNIYFYAGTYTALIITNNAVTVPYYLTTNGDFTAGNSVAADTVYVSATENHYGIGTAAATGHASCWKAGASGAVSPGYCSSAVAANGTCTCN